MCFCFGMVFCWGLGIFVRGVAVYTSVYMLLVFSLIFLWSGVMGLMLQCNCIMSVFLFTI